MTDSERDLLLAMARGIISLLDDSAREMDRHYAQAIQRLAEAIPARRPSRPIPLQVCQAGAAQPPWSAEAGAQIGP